MKRKKIVLRSEMAHTSTSTSRKKSSKTSKKESSKQKKTPPTYHSRAVTPKRNIHSMGMQHGESILSSLFHPVKAARASNVVRDSISISEKRNDSSVTMTLTHSEHLGVLEDITLKRRVRRRGKKSNVWSDQRGVSGVSLKGGGDNVWKRDQTTVEEDNGVESQLLHSGTPPSNGRKSNRKNESSSNHTTYSHTPPAVTHSHKYAVVTSEKKAKKRLKACTKEAQSDVAPHTAPTNGEVVSSSSQKTFSTNSNPMEGSRGSTFPFGADRRETNGMQCRGQEQPVPCPHDDPARNGHRDYEEDDPSSKSCIRMPPPPKVIHVNHTHTPNTDQHTNTSPPNTLITENEYPVSSLLAEMQWKEEEFTRLSQQRCGILMRMEQLQVEVNILRHKVHSCASVSPVRTTGHFRDAASTGNLPHSSASVHDTISDYESMGDTNGSCPCCYNNHSNAPTTPPEHVHVQKDELMAMVTNQGPSKRVVRNNTHADRVYMRRASRRVGEYDSSYSTSLEEDCAKDVKSLSTYNGAAGDISDIGPYR